MEFQRYIGATASLAAGLFFVWIAARPIQGPIASATIRMSRGGRMGALSAGLLFLVIAGVGYLVR